jgi:hypothetical protein
MDLTQPFLVRDLLTKPLGFTFLFSGDQEFSLGSQNGDDVNY